MKKIVAGILMFAMLAALTVVGVSALTPSVQEKDITLVSATVNGEDADGKIVVTPYSKHETLDEEHEKALIAAHDELTQHLPDVVTGNYKVGALCDISWVGTTPMPATSEIKVSLKVNLGDSKVSAIYEDVATGKWDLAECTYEDGVVNLTLKHLCPVALLVDQGSVIVSDPSVNPPQTGDSMTPAVIALGALLVSGAVAAAVVSRKRENA